MGRYICIHVHVPSGRANWNVQCTCIHSLHYSSLEALLVNCLELADNDYMACSYGIELPQVCQLIELLRNAQLTLAPCTD